MSSVEIDSDNDLIESDNDPAVESNGPTVESNDQSAEFDEIYWKIEQYDNAIPIHSSDEFCGFILSPWNMFRDSPSLYKECYTYKFAGENKQKTIIKGVRIYKFYVPTHIVKQCAKSHNVNEDSVFGIAIGTKSWINIMSVSDFLKLNPTFPLGEEQFLALAFSRTLTSCMYKFA